MAKKKKKKHKKEEDFFIKVDDTLDKKYVDLLEEIQFMQADLKRETKKAKKKQKKKLKKGDKFYSTRMSDIEIRKKVIHEMEGTNFFERATNIIGDLAPICAILAKLVMTLILAILSIDVIKYTIKPETLAKINDLFLFARSVSDKLAVA